MDFSGAGTAIMLALAAVLWFVYLVPSWVRRREYLATELNATRLQRTIRVMAEAAEAPQEIQLELAAREAAKHEKLLRQEQRRAEAETRAELRAAAARARIAEARAAEIERAARAAEAEAERAASAALRAQRAATTARDGLRRARRLAGLVLLASLVVAAVQVWLMVANGPVVGSWVVLIACASGAAASISLQNRIVARTRSLAGEEAPVRTVARRSASTLIDAELAPEPVREWTPVPLPKPLYVERHQPPREPVVPPVSAEALLRAAAEEAERALAAAHAEPEVVKFPVRAAEPAAVAAPAPSRFASMGRVDASAVEFDLDEILQRRRSG
ncbi:hypothetical protein [Salinibacterium sp. ZJ77]|uniref:hypothetical protein n=1 Tax=Salinibacterium sp. ZJ77 TaxID=2708337 RepID=UPI001424136A|nr:hypothetical protein [Salinibacterium sp. ZJ77]